MQILNGGKDLILCLEDMLESARKGEYHAIGFIGANGSGITTSWAWIDSKEAMFAYERILAGTTVFAADIMDYMKRNRE